MVQTSGLSSDVVVNLATQVLLERMCIAAVTDQIPGTKRYYIKQLHPE